MTPWFESLAGDLVASYDESGVRLVIRGRDADRDVLDSPLTWADIKVLSNLRRPRNQHYGSLKSFPPYVGGDDDEITSWQAECACSFRGRETPYLSVANSELVAHLNEALRATNSHESPQQ